MKQEKKLTPEQKKAMIQAGGSVKTKNVIDAQEIVREMRNKE